MKITVTLMNTIRKDDYMIEDDVSIQSALKIIQENDAFELPDNISYVFSNRMRETISTALTFKQAGIFTGDTILIITDGGKQE